MRGPEFNIRYKKSFADGGMLVQPNDDGSRPGYSGKYGPNIRKLTKSDSLEVQVVRGGTGGGKGGQKFYKTFNFDDYGGEAKTLKAAKEYRDSLPKIKKDTGKQSKGQPIGFKKETGGQSEIRKILKEIIKVGGKSFSNEDIRQLIDTGLFPDDDQFRKAVDVVKKEPEFKNLTFEKKPRPRLKTDPVSVLMAKTKERRNKKINILGSKDYEKELYKYKKEIQEALGLEKYKTSGSISGKPRELLPIEMGHQSSIKQLSLLKQKMRPEDLSPQNYEVNRKGVKKNKGGVQTLEDNLNKKFYPEQKKLYIKAKKFIDAGKTVPADLQNKIVSLNEDIQKFVDNTVKKYPLLKDRVNPITIDANDLTVKRGDNVFKQLGIGLVDQDLGDIKIGSMDDLTIKANLAEQTFREAVDAGLIDEKIGRQRLDKFLNVRDTEILKAEQKPIKNLIASFGGGTCSVFSGKKATLKADGGRIGLATGTPNIDDCFKSGSAVINSGKVPVDKADDFVQLLKRAGGIGRNIMKFGIIPEAMYVAADSLIRVGMGDTFTEAALRASDYVLPGDQTKTAEISKVSRIFGDETGELVGRAIDYKNQLAKIKSLEQQKENFENLSDGGEFSYVGDLSSDVKNTENLLSKAKKDLDNKFKISEAEQLYAESKQDDAYDASKATSFLSNLKRKYGDSSNNLSDIETLAAPEKTQMELNLNMLPNFREAMKNPETRSNLNYANIPEKDVKKYFTSQGKPEEISSFLQYQKDLKDAFSLNKLSDTFGKEQVYGTQGTFGGEPVDMTNYQPNSNRFGSQQRPVLYPKGRNPLELASGGIASLTKTIPPESGPTPQGLPYVYNNVKKI